MSRIPKKTRMKVFRRDKWKCLNCHSKKQLTVDHIVPVSLGGGDGVDNLQTLCKTCNERKGNGSTKDYRGRKCLPVMDYNMKCTITL